MCSVYKIIIIAISLLSSLVFLRGWEVPGVGNTSSWRDWEVTPGPRLGTCAKKRQNQFLQTFNSDRQLLVQKKPSLEQQSSFELDN